MIQLLWYVLIMSIFFPLRAFGSQGSLTCPMVLKRLYRHSLSASFRRAGAKTDLTSAKVYT